MKNHSEEFQGTLYAIFAFTFWGLAPIYFKAVSHVSPTEVLVHRIIWSVVLLFILIFIAKQTKTFILTIQNKEKLKILFLSALLVSTNWLIFIWAVGNSKITEASLGYYINPLVNVFLGMIFFGERLNKIQIISIFLAFLAILYELIALGKIPYISLALAFSFGFYGLARKKANIPSITGLFIETLLITPLAIAYLVYLFYIGENSFTFSINFTSLLLILAGLITVIPLLWFNSAATRISMFKLGFLQYIGPSISFLLAIFIYKEPFNEEKLYTFILIWIALVLFTFSDLKKFQTVKKSSK